MNSNVKLIMIEKGNDTAFGVNYMPFRAVNGAVPTKEHLETIGFFVDTIPEATNTDTQVAVLKVTGTPRIISNMEPQATQDLVYNRNLISYEYVDIQPEPPSVEQQRIEALEMAVAELSMMITQSV